MPVKAPNFEQSTAPTQVIDDFYLDIRPSQWRRRQIAPNQPPIKPTPIVPPRSLQHDHIPRVIVPLMSALKRGPANIIPPVDVNRALNYPTQLWYSVVLKPRFDETVPSAANEVIASTKKLIESRALPSTGPAQNREKHLVKTLKKRLGEWCLLVEHQTRLLHTDWLDDSVSPLAREALTLEFRKLFSLAGGERYQASSEMDEVLRCSSKLANNYLDLTAAYLAPSDWVPKNKMRREFEDLLIKTLLQQSFIPQLARPVIDAARELLASIERRTMLPPSADGDPRETALKHSFSDWCNLVKSAVGVLQTMTCHDVKEPQAWASAMLAQAFAELFAVAGASEPNEQLGKIGQDCAKMVLAPDIDIHASRTRIKLEKTALSMLMRQTFEHASEVAAGRVIAARQEVLSARDVKTNAPDKVRKSEMELTQRLLDWCRLVGPAASMLRTMELGDANRPTRREALALEFQKLFARVSTGDHNHLLQNLPVEQKAASQACADLYLKYMHRHPLRKQLSGQERWQAADEAKAKFKEAAARALLRQASVERASAPTSPVPLHDEWTAMVDGKEMRVAVHLEPESAQALTT